MALLSVRNLGVCLDERWVLRDVNLDVGDGEIAAVFGLSESGKSTLAAAIGGLVEPARGSIEFPDPWHGGRGTAAIGFDTPAVARDLTVNENLALAASLWGVGARKRGKRIAHVLELVGLTNSRSMLAQSLSTGALRRLELARVLIADAPLLVIDGLLDTLDSGVFDRVWDHLLSLRRDDRKSVLVLTSLEKVAGRCPRVAVLHNGGIGFDGEPDEFRRLAGEDMVVLGDVNTPAVRSRIAERFSVIINEEEGFLSFRVNDGEGVVGDLLAEFGSDVSCVYLKRPTLEDALAALAEGSSVLSVAPIRERTN